MKDFIAQEIEVGNLVVATHGGGGTPAKLKLYKVKAIGVTGVGLKPVDFEGNETGEGGKHLAPHKVYVI